MADYSWVDLQFRSRDPEIVKEVRALMGGLDEGMVDNAGTEWTNVGSETSYGTCEEAEAFLVEKGIAWSRYSDGKYDYDGDEAHWKPGMDTQRVFTRLNNGGRCFTEADLQLFVPQVSEHADEELGAFVREFFAFKIEEEEVSQTAN